MRNLAAPLRLLGFLILVAGLWVTATLGEAVAWALEAVEARR